MSRHRKQRLSAIVTCQKELGPDRAITIHEFADGWTIRVIPDEQEAHREGKLMHLCMRHKRAADMMFATSTLEDIGGILMSLRDADNFPHLTFLHDPDSMLTFMAEGNGSAHPKPAYRQRVDDWHATLPYPSKWMRDEETQELVPMAQELAESLQWLGDVLERDAIDELPDMAIDDTGRRGRYHVKVGRHRWQ